jgi:mRNA interferase MazF
MKKEPFRGEIWLADLDPTRGHEQGGKRPVLIISADIYNTGPAGLVVALPLTKTHRGIPLHLPLAPREGGLKTRSAVLCDAVRSISKDRLLKRWGVVTPNTIHEIEDRLRILMGL